GMYSLISDLYLRDRSRLSQRVDKEFRKRQYDRARKAVLFKNLSPQVGETSFDEEHPTSLRQRLEFLLEQSGLNLTIQRLLLLMGVAGLGLGALGGALLRAMPAAAVGALLGASIPLLYVLAKRKARLEKLISQLPDAFDLMGRVIRAGQTMSQALQAV